MSWSATGGDLRRLPLTPTPLPHWGEGLRSRRAAWLFPSGGGVGSLLPAGRRAGDEGVCCARRALVLVLGCPLIPTLLPGGERGFALALGFLLPSPLVEKGRG